MYKNVDIIVSDNYYREWGDIEGITTRAVKSQKIYKLKISGMREWNTFGTWTL